jgi:glutamyl-tRNA synthetase
MPTTRLAPSPTGALHLGNARTFLVNWALARQQGWDVILRIEDLDGPRVKPESIQGTIDTLQWLGLDWQGRVLLTTVHRRENWGEPLIDIAEAFKQLLNAFPDIQLVLPLPQFGAWLGQPKH